MIALVVSLADTKKNNVRGRGGILIRNRVLITDRLIRKFFQEDIHVSFL